MNLANTQALALLGNYLNERADFLRPQDVQPLLELGLTSAQAVAQLVACACGLDVLNRAEDKRLFDTYFRPAFSALHGAEYQQDAYIRHIKFPTQLKQGNFTLTCQTYQPYECFVWNDLYRGPAGEVLAPIGFFEEPFTYPAVLENNRIWMTVTPNEIETMRAPLARAKGRVLTFGLGLGYFAFHASQKEDVSHVTVVEQSPHALALFTQYILPQFPYASKIQLIQADAFAFAAHPAQVQAFDYVFVDLWRDVSDGLAKYQRMKSLLMPTHVPCIDYWIEPTLQFYS